MFVLFVDSANSVELEGEWDYEEDAKKMEASHRSRSGRLFRYIFGTYGSWKFSAQFVNSSSAAIVNSWWLTNTKLKFFESSSAGVSAVQDVVLSSDGYPFTGRVKPYQDYFEGTIELETY